MLATQRANNVFVPGGLPVATYIARTNRSLEYRLLAAQDNLCKLVTLTGPTKCGKTVLVKKVFPSNKVVWIDGGRSSTEAAVWSAILSKLHAYSTFEEGSSSRRGDDTHAGMDARINLGIGQIGATVGGAGSNSIETSRTASRQDDPKSAAVAALERRQVPLVIDDFHYLRREDQGAVVRALKSLVFQGIPVVVLSIPHRRYDAVRVEREMTGRIERVDVPAWDNDELAEIGRVGFPLLNIRVPEVLLLALAEEALGSPHLMQEFCREICRKYAVTETLPTELVISDMNALPDIHRHVAQNTGRLMFDKLKRGPIQRARRIQRRLRDGTTADIYGVVITALAELRPKVETFSYETLWTAIRTIAADHVPQAQEVSRVLEHMARISTTDESSTPVIDWDKDDMVLHITDPFFAYYLRWGGCGLASPPDGNPQP
jgi:hypothetical protein